MSDFDYEAWQRANPEWPPVARDLADLVVRAPRGLRRRDGAEFGPGSKFRVMTYARLGRVDLKLIDAPLGAGIVLGVTLQDLEMMSMPTSPALEPVAPAADAATVPPRRKLTNLYWRRRNSRWHCYRRRDAGQHRGKRQFAALCGGHNREGIESQRRDRPRRGTSMCVKCLQEEDRIRIEEELAPINAELIAEASAKQKAKEQHGQVVQLRP